MSGRTWKSENRRGVAFGRGEAPATCGLGDEDVVDLGTVSF